MPNGPLGVSNGLLCLASVCYSVTIEQSISYFFPRICIMLIEIVSVENRRKCVIAE